MALLIGFALDQQVTVQKAFSGPLVLQERLGTLDAATIAGADLEPIFRERPGDPSLPGRDGDRVRDLAAHIVTVYDGDAGACGATPARRRSCGCGCTRCPASAR